MKKFTQGGFVKDRDGGFSKILQLTEYTCELSEAWEEGEGEGEGEDIDHDGLRACDQHLSTYSIPEMEAFYTPCTANEAGFEEEGEIQIGERYYTPAPYADRKYIEYFWDDHEYDRLRKQRGLVCKTSEQAIEKCDVMLGAIH